MNPNPLKDDARSENSGGPGTPTLKMIRDRAIKLAWVNGRRASDLKPLDYVEAKRDLMGETENETRPTNLESAPEPEQPDPVSGPTGEKIPATAGDDEDDEESSDNETTVETKVPDAGQDRSVDPASPAEKKDE
jgi:hypothetical protein